MNDLIWTQREREAEEARNDLLRRAELQGVKPYMSLEEFKGESGLTADFDVDEFLHQIREDRDGARCL